MLKIGPIALGFVGETAVCNDDRMKWFSWDILLTVLIYDPISVKWLLKRPISSV